MKKKITHSSPTGNLQVELLLLRIHKSLEIGELSGAKRWFRGTASIKMLKRTHYVLKWKEEVKGMPVPLHAHLRCYLRMVKYQMWPFE